MHESDILLDYIRWVSPTYIRRLKGENISSVFHLNMVGFTISHIIQYHYILWSRPFQIVNPKVKDTYIILELHVFQGYVWQSC